MGYERADGSVGVRNHVVILSTVSCANPVVQHIAQGAPGAVPIIHAHGCGRKPEKPIHRDTLIGFGTHPNTYATIIVSLGCESIPTQEIIDGIKASGKPTEVLVIQDCGTVKTTQKGIELAKKYLEEAAKVERKEFPVSKLMLATQCGGSDALSGVTANPTIGKLTDWLVGEGGTSVLTESTEMIGTTAVLARRAVDDKVREDITRVIADAQKHAVEILGPGAARAIAPGNMDGGMTTIQEKSLGCIRKGGTVPLNEVVGYGQKPTRNGLIVMDGPGYDGESIAGLAMMGCQIMTFSTGRGTPMGLPIMPVIKLASNDQLYARMEDDMDFNAGQLISTEMTLDDAGEELVDLFLRVANGELTKAEKNDQIGVICLQTFSAAF